MRALVNLRDPPDVEVGVHLRRGEARVSEHVLDAPKVASALEQMSREAVAQPMGTDHRPCPRADAPSLDHGPDRTG